MPADPPVLWHLAVSHYSEKVRWALDHKGVPHVRRAVTPALQRVRARRLGTGTTVPILEIDGRAIGDSSRIIEEVERRWPEPPLYPQDAADRRRALDLEEYFDDCGSHVRRLMFADALTEPETFRRFVYGSDHPRTVLFLRAIWPAFERLVRRAYRIYPDRVERSRETVLAAFDRIEAETAETGYLVGDSFTIADLTAAAILALVVTPPELPYVKLPPDERSAQARRFRESLQDRPGFSWVRQMYARHRGAYRDARGASRSGGRSTRSSGAR